MAAAGWLFVRCCDRAAPPLNHNERFWQALYSDAPAFVPDGPGRLRLSAELVALDNAPRSFTVESAEGALRVLCVGGSTTAGWPFHPRGGFPAWLGAMLSDALGSPVEVVNAGLHAFGVLEDVHLLRELAPLRWDLVVAYEGTNVHHTAEACAPASVRWRARLDRVLLRTFAPYRLLKTVLGMRREGVNQAGPLAPESPEYRSCIAARLVAGLDDLGRLAKERGWTVLLVAPVRETPLYDGLDLVNAMRAAAGRHGLHFVDSGDYWNTRRGDEPRTIGDGIHPPLRGHWLIARSLVERLGAMDWPSRGALKLGRLRGRWEYSKRLGLTPSFLATVHARLGLMHVRIREPKEAKAEFAAADALEGGAVRAMQGPWLSEEESRAIQAFYASHSH